MSLTVAVMASIPTVTRAIFEYRNPPNPKIIVTEVGLQEAGLPLTLVNQGETIGTPSQFLGCRVRDAADKMAFDLVLESLTRVPVPPNGDRRIAFKEGAYAEIHFADGESHRFHLDPLPLRSLVPAAIARAREMWREAGMPDHWIFETATLQCTLVVTGRNNPQPAAFALTINEDVDSDAWSITIDLEPDQSRK